MRKQLVISFLMSVLYTQIGFGQPRLDFANPQAYSFMKYVEQPVDLFHGHPIIKVPIYNIKLNNFEFPIGISYHSGGIKVREEASEVGLGWNLQAYGVITQKVKGKNDLFYLNSTDWPIPIHGFRHTSAVYDHDELRVTVWDGLGLDASLSRVKTCAAGNPDINMEVDEFSYHFGDFSGSFFYDVVNKKFIDKKDPSIKIEYNKSMSSFIITDKLGNEYYFSVRQSNNHFYTHLGHNFYLSRIETATEEVITFDYDKKTTVTHFITDISQRTLSGDKTTLLPTFKTSQSVSNYKPIELKTITFPNGKIAFSRSNRIDLENTTQVDAITVTSGNQQIQKHTLNYTYFASVDKKGFHEATEGGWYTDNQLNKRLKLKSIQKHGEPAHVFTYEEVQLPNKSSYAVDLWGYYNGKLENTTYIPNLDYIAKGDILFDDNPYSGYSYKYHYKNNRGYHSDRRFDRKYAKAGLLKKIQYPTGGYRAFVFEPHIVSDKILSLLGFPYRDSFEVYDKNSDRPEQNVLQHTFKEKTVVNFTLRFKIPLAYAQCNANEDYFVEVIEHKPVVNGVPTGLRKKWDIGDCPDAYNEGGFRYGTQKISLTLDPGKYTFLASICPKYIKPDASRFAQARMNVDFALVSAENSSLIHSGGGFRIKEIKTSDMGTIRYDYTLKNSNKSSGKFNMPFNHAAFIRHYKRWYLRANTFACYPYSQKTSYILETKSDNKNTNSIVAYSRVVESRSNGSKAHYFHYKRGNLSLHPVIPNLNFFPKNGRLERMEIMDSDGVLKETISYKYTFYEGDGVSSAHVESMDLTNHNCPPTHYMVYYWKTIPYYVYASEKTVQRYYDSGGSSIQKTTYQYDSFLNKTKETTQDSENNTIEKRWYYPNPATYTASDLPLGMDNAILSAMQDKHMIGYPFLETTHRAGRLINKKETLYGGVAINPTYFVYLPQKIRSCKNEGGKADCSTTLFDYSQYSRVINLIGQKPLHGVSNAYFWGYQQKYPILQAKNIGFYALKSALTTLPTAYNSLEKLQALSNADTDRTIDKIHSDGTMGYQGKEGALRQALQALQQAVPQAQISYYTYDPLVGITSITDPRGDTTYFIYDELHRLDMVKDAEGNILNKNKYHYKNQ